MPLNDFSSNRKDLSAAIGLSRNMVALVEKPRFGGLSYTGIFHQYLIKKSNTKDLSVKDTSLQVYSTKVTDWGLGELWFLPESNKTKFIPTPLLYALGIFSKAFESGIKYGVIKVTGSIETLFIAEENRNYFLLFINVSSSPVSVDLRAKCDIHIIEGGLDARALPLNAIDNIGKTLKIHSQKLVLDGGFILPPFSLGYTYLESGKLNGVAIDEKLIGFKGMKDGQQLEIGSFGFEQSIDGFSIYPTGAIISGVSTELIPMSKKQIEAITESNIKNICCWSFEEED